MAAVSFGKRIGDGTTEAIDRLTKVGTAEQLDAMRADVVRALAKLDDGTYGLCDRCGALDPRGAARGPAMVGAVRRLRVGAADGPARLAPRSPTGWFALMLAE